MCKFDKEKTKNKKDLKNLQNMILQFWLGSYTNVLCVLCNSTSKRVLHTPFAGQNQFFDAKTTFSVTNERK